MQAPERHRACLSLGSNIDAPRHLREAIVALRARFGMVRVSPAYRFPAVGYAGADFVNAAAVVATDLDPVALDDWLHRLEDAHGRDRTQPRYSDRPLDIDIVLFDDLVLDGPGHLQLPRDELRHAFVLKPLAAIAPGVVEPRSGRTLLDLWWSHPDFGREFPVVGLEDAA